MPQGVEHGNPPDGLALVGAHPDGLALADALVASGRYRLLAYTTPVPAEQMRRWGEAARLVPDLEEVLADPAVDAVIVAGSPVNRPTQLRRALQSERHVLCVHPADQGPDTAYEAALIQRDTGCLLLPLLPEALHPAVRRLADLYQPGAPGGLRLVELERWSPGVALLDGGGGRKPALPGWDVLRRLGGEVAEVTAFAEREELAPAAPVFVSGRFEQGGLFRASYLPHQPEARWRLTVSGEDTRAELTFPEGWPGRALLRWHDATGTAHEQTWEPWDPWRALAEVFESATDSRPAGPGHEPGPARAAIQAHRPEAPAEGVTARAPVAVPGATSGKAAGRGWHLARRRLTWQDEVRSLELDDAARRSAERRRATVLEYPDATEEAGFKGTMTLLGCGLLWLVLVLAIVSAWLPRVGWAILPLLFVFLVLQLFLRLARRQEPPRHSEEETPGTDG